MSRFNYKQSNPSALLRSLLVGSLCVWLPLQAQAASVEQRLAKVERLVQSQGLIQLMNQVDDLQLELQRLRGEIEFQTHSLEQIKKRQRDLYIDVDRRLQSVETRGAQGIAASPVIGAGDIPTSSDGNPPLQVLSGSAAVDSDTPAQENPAQLAPLTIEVQTGQAAAGTLTAAAQTGDAASETVQISNNPPAVATTETIAMTAPGAEPTADPALAEQAYKQAFNLLKTAQHEQAMKEFAAFVEQYPDSPYAANAQYWLGEAYYVKQRFDEAIAEFRLLVENYPDSQKLTHSLLKIGYSLHELKQYDEAIKVLSDLQARYPGTSAARYAGERLQKVRSDQSGSAVTPPQG